MHKHVAPPWVTLQPVIAPFWGTNRSGAVLLLAPRTHAVGDVVQAARRVGEARFCWYTRSWLFSSGPDPAAWRRTIGLARALLGGDPMPMTWVLAHLATVSSALPGHFARVTADGYDLRFPASSSALDVMIRLGDELGDDAHAEWTSRGCEWIVRKKVVHRRMRTLLELLRFRIVSTNLDQFLPDIRNVETGRFAPAASVA